jgi:hypothetical protein
MATTTVYFATTHVLNGPAEDWKSYGTNIVSPSDPTAITYAVAFVDSTELAADKTGFITDIRDVKPGHFSENVISDLQDRDEICWFSSMALTTTLRPRSPAPCSSRMVCAISRVDGVLVLDATVNLGAKRLGQDGPHNRFDTTRFPPAQYQWSTAPASKDYPFNFASSHQYYRRSPGVRVDIAQVMTGFSPAVSSRSSRRRRGPSPARCRGP